jgi:hypothetical protein
VAGKKPQAQDPPTTALPENARTLSKTNAIPKTCTGPDVKPYSSADGFVAAVQHAEDFSAGATHEIRWHSSCIPLRKDQAAGHALIAVDRYANCKGAVRDGK